ncbi:3632_t:CDS:2, partial [Ambispora gerdemannii]
KDLSHTIQLHPSFFGPNMDDFLKRKLHSDVEGTCTGRFGYIINVLTVKEISKGKVLPSIGLAEFTVKYQAIVFKPFKHEVVDGTVTSVNKLIPTDMKFNPYINPPAFSDENNTIEKGSNCRIKIVGTRFDATDIFAIGTIKEDFCGIL